MLADHLEWFTTEGQEGKRADFTSIDLQGVNFQEANLREAYFESANLEGVNFQEASLRGAMLKGANLEAADLQVADFKGADLREANLRGADLQGADLQGADLRGADLSGADLKGADLKKAVLEGANLEGAQLQEANLEKANLRRADLQDADLQGAELRDADLSEADLRNADLWRANTETTRFDYAIIDKESHAPVPAAYSLTAVEENDHFVLGAAENKVIRRFIEFPPQYHKAGVDILNYFSEVLRKKHPEHRARVRIEQDGLKVALVIEPINGQKEIIEKTLREYGMVISGRMSPEEFTDDRMMLIELRAELRAAYHRIEIQRELLRDRTIQVDKMLDILGKAVAGRPSPHAIRNGRPTDAVKAVYADQIEQLIFSDAASHPNLMEEKHMGDTININAKGDVAFAKNQAIATVNKRIGESNAPEELQQRLKQLTDAVSAMIAGMPEPKAKEVSEDLATLVNEATREAPRRKWYELSGEGLIEAARAVGALGEPVARSVRGVMDALNTPLS